ncbi:copper chaperone for superoxide dismutase [Paramormyrops kingsleyae]|uniref:copper chaperone for superoxide dismutase n=1 Tax=Paramormyrops kingsleyae TaxID=1676925 RepID=UPI003B96F129
MRVPTRWWLHASEDLASPQLAQYFTSARLEFAVQMTCSKCVMAVQSALEGVPGVQSVAIDLAQEQVLVESTLMSQEVQALIESTGRRAVLKGVGTSGQGHP